MVLRSKSVGEQDVADQQGAFLCREDLTFVGSSFLIEKIFENSIKIFTKNPYFITYYIFIVYHNIYIIFLIKYRSRKIIFTI